MKPKRQGEKIGGEHSTFNDLAVGVADFLQKLPEVHKISPGYITSGIGGGAGRRHVKIIDETGCILLTCKQSSSVQEVRVFTKNPQSVKLALARWLRDSKIEISFDSHT